LAFGIGAGGFAVGVGWGYPAYAGPYGAYGYWGRPLGWGFGGWGLGTTVYTSGYYPYYNPYYYQPAYPTVVYDYSRPIAVAIQAPPGTPSNVYDSTSPPNSGAPPATPPLDNPAFDMARESFKRGDYVAALKDVDAAIRRSPSDAVMHEFRSLTLFALHDYRQSAAVAHAVLAVGPGWDYTTMSSLYADPFTYSEQLQRLENYTREHPRAADAHFLLAYHEMIGSRKEEAAAELNQVVRLMPNDRLAAELLMMVKGPAKQSPANPVPYGSPKSTPDLPPIDSDSVPAPSVASSPETPAIDKSLLPGTWNASRDDGSKFRLTMTSDGRFTWQYSAPNQKAEELTGNYSVDGPVLVLERKEGGALAGTAQFTGDSKLNFKMVGGPPEDTGLNFGRL
jgi:tetratricopeptide (TPR) repeat protein